MNISKRRQTSARMIALAAAGVLIFAAAALLLDSPLHSERYDFRGRMKELIGIAWILSVLSLALSRNLLAWIVFVPGAVTVLYLVFR